MSALRNSNITLLLLVWVCKAWAGDSGISFIAEHVSCFGESDGKIVISATQEIPSEYSIQITDSTGNQIKYLTKGLEDKITIQELSAGKYTLNFTSGTQKDSYDITLKEPEKLRGNEIELMEEPSSQTACDGKLRVSPGGGVPPYTISWNDGMGDDAIFESACWRIHRCKISDANNCGPVEVSFPMLPEVVKNMKK